MSAERRDESRQPDRAREVPPSERKARAGLLLPTVKTRTEAALKAGYSPATVKNLTANGLTAEEMEKAAKERFPREFNNTVRSIRGVNLKLLNRIAEIADDPQASEAALVSAFKVTSDAITASGEDEITAEERAVGVAHFLRWRRRLARLSFMAGARHAALNGFDSALATAEEIERRDAIRYPRRPGRG